MTQVPAKDLEGLKREAVRWCLANANHMDLEELGNAIIDHLHASGHIGAREGFVMVPIEPTEEMFEAIDIDLPDEYQNGKEYDFELFRTAYKAMLSASSDGSAGEK